MKTDYKKATDDQLDSKADAVVLGLTTHAVEFPAPPLSPAALQDLIDVYEQTYSAYKRGGIDQKEEFLNAKTDLLNAMDSIADYVDSIAKGNGAVITNGGFVPTKGVYTPQQKPDRPVGVLVKYGNSHGEVTVESPVVEGAEFYGLLGSEGMPFRGINIVNGVLVIESISSPIGFDFNKGRKKVLTGLKTGTTYYFIMYAGNSAGVSGFSDPVQIMAV